MTLLYAQPYNTSVEGFYFKTVERYQQKAAGLTDSFGQPVEEFEIQFIDGKDEDRLLADTMALNQSLIGQYFELVEAWEDHEKIRSYIAVCERGYSFDAIAQNIDLLDVDLYEVDNLNELAERFAEDGVFGEIPDRLAGYIDLDAIARDLSCDYAMICVAGMRLAYRFG